MKVIIQNVFIDFSTITHIEDNEKEIILFPFMSEKIIFKNSFSIEINVRSTDTENSLKERYKKEFEEFDKHEIIFNNLKEKILKYWQETDSCIKDIKKIT